MTSIDDAEPETCSRVSVTGVARVGLSTDAKCSQAEVFRWAIPTLRSAHTIDTNHFLMQHHNLWIVQQTVLERSGGAELDAAAKMKIPVVILERIDGSQITDKTRKHIDHPNVVAVAKNTLARPEQIHNASSGRIHMKHLGEAAQPGKALDDASLIKLVTGYSFASYKKVRNLFWDWTGSAAQIRTRTVKAGFWGTVQYEVPELSEHRNRAMQILQQMQGCWGAPGRGFDLPTYADWVKRSSAIVSPWGYGESCYRDYEAILAGAVLIKPACPWVYDATGIYRPDGRWAPMVRYCKPDWSDLPEHIEAAQEVTDEQRILARNRMIHLTSMEAVARRLAAILRAAIESWETKKPIRSILAGV